MSTNSISLRGAEQNLEGTIGQTIRRYLQVNDQEGNLIDLGAVGITVTGDVLDSDGVSVESWSVAITDGIAIFTLSAAKTTSIGEQSGLGYAFKVTESGVVNYYIEGSFELFPPGSPHKLRHRSGLADEAQVVVSGGTTLTLTAATPLTLLDEDDFASDSAVKPPSQQSTKAFIEAALAGKIQFATSPPAGPDGADIWIDSNTMDMYARYEDGSSSQWVLVASVSNALVADDALAVAEAAVAKSGDTMTGDLRIENTTPSIIIEDTNGTTDERTYQMRVRSGDGLAFEALDDTDAVDYVIALAEPNSGSPTLNLTGNTGGVTVPDANADGEALAYDQANWKLRSGEIDSGGGDANLTFTAGSDATVARISAIGDGRLYIRQSDDDGATWVNPIYLDTANRVDMRGAAAVYVPDADADGEALAYDQDGWVLGAGVVDGGNSGTPLDVKRNSGTVTVRLFSNNAAVGVISATEAGTLSIGGGSGSGPLNVPAISGANQAAQVTAYNATTGQLQIGGHEVGDTGWRNLLTTWSGSGWDTIADSPGGWRFSQYSWFRIRRVGDVVYLAVSGIAPAESVGTNWVSTNGASVTNAQVWSVPTGFKALSISGGRPLNAFAYQGPSYAPSEAKKVGIAPFWVNNGAALTIINSGAYSSTSVGTGAPPNDAQISADMSWVTVDAWPTSLPGTAA